MKKYSLLLLLLLATALCGCSKQPETQRIQVVATVFPAYDWAKEIVGSEDIDVTMLGGNGVDLHSYQVTVQDMARIARCDLFVYVGGESDEWVEEVLNSVPNPNRIELNLMEALDGRLHLEETVEGMQVRAEEEEEAYDEHIWLSLRNAAVCCDAICDALCELDEAHAETYRQNNTHYLYLLDMLDLKYTQAVAGAAQNTLLFADRFPFRYLAEDYKLTYYAAFSGCSGDSEASFATVLFLARKLDELGLKQVCILESSDDRLAQTVIGCTGRRDQTIAVLDSMQSVSLKDAADTYLIRMERNLEALTGALR